MWVITKDHLETDKELGSEYKRRGLWGPSEQPEVFYRWRVLDDDGEVYYEGYSTEKDFAPLNFSMTDAGATEVQYMEGGKWVTL